MKTFKLISLQVAEKSGLIDIRLEDGLAINKEDSDRTWLLEAYVAATYEPYFQALLDAGHEISLQVVISRAENDPAYFQAKSLLMKKLADGHLSLLFKGKINQANTYPELLLAALIENGLSGQELLREFKEKMLTKPKLSPKK
ncbi:YwpF family protein [Bacillus tuaregi]|uniref:YwpF family protein n=1 Tax=Bacillus tuaregi TaxID=1816695 RepID=UPI0008F861BD|nr:YwpF family protein [Bacillus tuaregi]